MKTKALKRFRSKLADNEPVYGLWATLESASVTEMAVALGMDWVVIDAEHGHLDWKEINEHIRAGLRSDTVILIRLAERSTALTKRALDIGADGIVVPWVSTVEELEEAIRLGCLDFNQYGITSVIDPGLMPYEIRAYQTYYQDKGHGT